MAGRPLRPPRPPDWRRPADSDSDASDDSYSSDSSDEERPGPARENTPRRGCCSGKRAPSEPPPDAAPEKAKRDEYENEKGKDKEKETVKLPRSLRKVAAVPDNEVPVTLWAKPSRALALERAEAHQPRFKARPRRLCVRPLAALNPRPARRPPTGGGTPTTCCRRRRSRLGAPSALVMVRGALAPRAWVSAASVACAAGPLGLRHPRYDGARADSRFSQAPGSYSSSSCSCFSRS